jgi:hypothetical protein
MEQGSGFPPVPLSTVGHVVWYYPGVEGNTIGETRVPFRLDQTAPPPMNVYAV